MRIILKVFAAPFILALTVVVAMLTFLHRIAGAVLNILCCLLVIAALFSIFVEGDYTWGIQGLIMAFCCSSVGVPALAGWLIDRLDAINYSLQCFMAH